MKQKLFLIMAAMLFSVCSFAQNTALWLRYPAISPDGKTIAFGYKGDIYRVDAKGGTAVPLTIHEAQDMMPVWSHDGKYIAFASDRYGNFDVFVMPAGGGAPKRLTYNSFDDFPYDFSPDDKQVIFGSTRNAPAQSIRFSIPIFNNLYSVAVTGGRPLLISAAGMENAHYNSKGTQIVFQDTKGYENEFRKHHTSAVTKDVWLFDIKDKTYRKISSFEGEDREPIFSNDDQFIYYLSEKNGSQNIFKTPVTNKTAEQQLTSFTNHPVRHLSSANDNTLCFTYNGEIYTLKDGAQPQKINIQVFNDGRTNVEKNIPINGNVSEFVLSPNGKEIAFVTHGEIFVTSTETSQTKRITNTPQQERMVQWSPDSRSLIYAAERNNSWDIYKTSIARKDELYFYASTILKEEPVIATEKEEYQPKYSPDGKEIAYIEERNILRVYNVASKETRTVLPEGHNYSYSDGDWDFQWSPDSKWLIMDDQKGYFNVTNTLLIKADGSQSTYPINGGFGEGDSKWALGGKAMTWATSRNGKRSQAVSGNSEVDIYTVFFDKPAFDEFKLSKDDYALFNEEKEKQKKDSLDAIKDKDKDKNKKTNKKDSVAKDSTLKLDLTNLDSRKLRLTINSSSISDYALSPKGDKLYYLSTFEKGFDLWVTEPRTKETRILAKLGGSPSGIEISKDGNNLFVSNNGALVKVETASGKVTPVGINGEMVLNTVEERNYIFEHVWRQVVKKFYDPKLHNVDWAMYKATYAKFLPHITNNYDFAELLSELLGELNASHTGSGYYMEDPTTDNTAALGLLFDETYTGKGLKITEVIAGSPLDNATSKVKAGNILEKIDGEEITDSIDWSKLLNRKRGINTLLSVYNDDTKTHFDEVIKPISIGNEINLMYKRWVNKMRDMVDKLSGGKVGYVHVRSMDDGSYRAVIDEVMGKNLDKEALIVDTRFNGGGWLHDDLNTFLSGKNYLKLAPQKHMLKGGEPLGRWQKPTCVVMSECNYSDAFIFPYIYKQTGTGKLIGMPVAGTGTAVWWETQIDPSIYFGIPMVATYGKENRPTENLQLEPDIKVPLPYEEFLSGKDAQIEAAVTEMLKQIKK
jgi:tricorn protease